MRPGIESNYVLRDANVQPKFSSTDRALFFHALTWRCIEVIIQDSFFVWFALFEGEAGENPARSRHCEKDEAERMNDEDHSGRSPKFFKSGYLARSLASGMFRGKTSNGGHGQLSQSALFTDSMDQRTRRFSID